MEGHLFSFHDGGRYCCPIESHVQLNGPLFHSPSWPCAREAATLITVHHSPTEPLYYIMSTLTA